MDSKIKCGCHAQCVECILDTDNYYCEDAENKMFKFLPEVKKVEPKKEDKNND
jgi:hypothetical protein